MSFDKVITVRSLLICGLTHCLITCLQIKSMLKMYLQGMILLSCRSWEVNPEKDSEIIY